MYGLQDIHGEVFDHEEPCPDLNCCMCDCSTCKRAWWAAGRPHPKDCPIHGERAQPKPPSKTVYDHLREAADDES